MEVLYSLSGAFITDRVEPAIDAGVLLSEVDWGHIGDGRVDVIRVVALVIKRGLPAFAGPAGDPFAGVEFVKRSDDVVHVVGGVFDGEVFPVKRRGRRFSEVAMLDSEEVRTSHHRVEFASVHSPRFVAFGSEEDGAC